MSNIFVINKVVLLLKVICQIAKIKFSHSILIMLIKFEFSL